MRFLVFLAAWPLLWCLGANAYAGEGAVMRLHGSNTIGASLAPALVKTWMASQGFRNISQRDMSAEDKQITGIDRNGRPLTVEIKSHGSSTGFKSLNQGVADIGMSSRPIKSSEEQSLARFGNMTDVDAEYVIGLDGIAVIVNRVNVVDAMDKDVIRKIFSGEITDWHEVNKTLAGPIHVYARDDKSGTYDTFRSLVLGKKSTLVKNARRYESNAALSDDVAKDALGIGFVGLPYVRNSKALAVAEQGALARLPKPFEVATEDYALARRLYMYVPQVEGNSNVQSFIEFSISDAGQTVVENSGFISQNLAAHDIELNEGFPEEYLKLTANGERLSLNFRFRKGSTRLDNKAHRDLLRLSKYLSRPENRERKVMLFGFSESSESLPVFSVDLSEYRVDWVSHLLAMNGIDTVRVRGYGDAIPVASNEDAGGRHKNRRVEVWLTR